MVDIVKCDFPRCGRAENRCGVCDKFAPSADRPSNWRTTLEEVASALDKSLGDSDLTHIEDDEELRDAAPVQWACSQVNKLLQAPASSARPSEAQDRDEAIRKGLIYNLRAFAKATPYFSAPSLVDTAIEAANFLEDTAPSATRRIEPCHEALRTAKSVIKLDKSDGLIPTKRDVVLLALEVVRQSEGTAK